MQFNAEFPRQVMNFPIEVKEREVAGLKVQWMLSRKESNMSMAPYSLFFKACHNWERIEKGYERLLIEKSRKDF